MTEQSTISERTALPELSQLTSDQQRALLARLLQEKAKRSNIYPMSAGQQGLWHAFRRNPQSTAFNVFLPTRMRSDVHIDAMRQSIEFVSRRHHSLRTTFSDTGGKLVQQINEDLLPEFRVIDLRGTSEDTVRERLTAETLQPFDLERGPLLRILACQLAEQDWVFLALTHHIIVDFWSLILIMSELRTAYPCFVSGTTPSLPAAQNNYAQFVKEQTQLIDGPNGDLLRNYWKTQLEGTPPSIELPLDRMRPSTFTGKAAMASIPISKTCSSNIHRLSQQLRCTPFAIVHAAIQVFLHRYSRQESFFIGSPFSGRGSAKYEKTVGFFINMLPIKAEVKCEHSFADLAHKTSNSLLDTLEHEAFPIAEMVRLVTLPRDPSRSPLFQVSCTYEKSHVEEESGRAGFLFPQQEKVFNFGGLRQESFYIPHQTCHYDLEFVFEHSSAGLQAILLYCQDLFSAATAEQMATNFSTLLEALVQDNHLPMRQVGWGQPIPVQSCVDATPTPPHTVPAMIQTAAELGENSIALRSVKEQITYGEFVHFARKLAHELVIAGANSNSLIPVYCEDGLTAFYAMLAVQLTGAACIPLDSKQPSIRLADLVKNPRVTHLLSDCLNLPIDPSDARCVDARIARIRSQLEPPVVEPSINNSDPKGLAYIVFTSGTTGVPKGVEIEHRAVCNTLTWRKQCIPLSPADRVLMLLSHQFDAGLGIAWSVLTQGAALIWPNVERSPDPNALIDQIVRDRITVLPCVPSLLRILALHPRFSECRSLRQVWTGGEAMPNDLPEIIRQTLNVQFWNLYGPTEASIEAIAMDVTQHDSQHPVPLGSPILNTQVLILDEMHQPVPPTVPGEIAIAGNGLARGYLDHPKLTQERFIAHPLAPNGNQRVYLTGDRGRARTDGLIEFLGRTDHQVKLRGYRVELGEIDNVLQSHPLVERAAVKVITPDSPSAQLIAFISLGESHGTKPNTTPTDPQQVAYQVREFAAERLPAYKVPAAIVILDSLPVTSSDKVDRKQLPDHVPGLWQQQYTVPASTPLEHFLVERWCETLQIEHLGINQNFFDAGGSSLQAAMLTTQLSSELGIHIPTSLLFDLPDIVHIAHRLVELHRSTIQDRFGISSIAKYDQQLNESFTAQKNHPLIAPLKTAGSKRPLFMVHPPGGIVVCYRELAQAFAEDQPLYAIRSRGLHGEEALPQSMQEMAADYLDAIRSIQPTGPYILGGWSLGGLIAYAMAQALIESGEEVQQLVLLDTTIPEGASQLVPLQEQVNVGLEYGIELNLEQLGKLAPEEQLPLLREHALNLGVLDEQSPAEVVAKVLLDLQELFHHHITLAQQYKLPSLDCELLLIRPSEVPIQMQVTPDRGWRHLVRQVEVVFTPGHHHSMVQSPNVQQLASQLLRRLRS